MSDTLVNPAPTKFRYRSPGLKKRARRYAFGTGIICSFDIMFHGEHPTPAKTIVFETCRDMRAFYKGLQELGTIPGGGNLGRTCRGVVSKMWTDVWVVDKDGDMKHKHTIVDKQYCCIVLLVEGHLRQEIISHEAIHVGFAHRMRHGDASPYTDPDMDEEAICYPGGWWAGQLAIVIEEERLRTTGGDSKRARTSYKRPEKVPEKLA